MTGPSLDPILAYLREHSGRYSLSALRDQLVESGYDPAEVDRAIAIRQQESPPTAPLPIWPKALLVVGINAVLILRGSEVSESFLFSLIFCGELLGGAVLAIWQKSRVWGLALVFGFLLTIGLGILFVGLCFLIFAQGSNWH